MKLFLDGTKGSSEVIGIPRDNPVEFTNDLLVEVMAQGGKVQVTGGSHVLPVTRTLITVYPFR